MTTEQNISTSFLSTIWTSVKKYGPAFFIGAGVGAAGTYAVMKTVEEPSPVVVETPQGEIILN